MKNKIHPMIVLCLVIALVLSIAGCVTSNRNTGTTNPPSSATTPAPSTITVTNPSISTTTTAIPATTTITTTTSAPATTTTTTAAPVAEKPYVWKPDPDDLEWKDDISPVTLTAFLNFSSTMPFEWGKNDVTQEITKRTGITIEATYAPDNDSQRLSVMLASGDKLPDFIIGPKPPDPLYYNMIKDDVIWSYTELMDKYAPNMRKVMMKGNEELCAEEDGKLYWLGMTMVGLDQTNDERITPPPKFAIRNDVWEALGKPEIKTPEDLINVARKVKAGSFEGIRYPVFLDVVNNIPVGTMFGIPGSQNGWIYDATTNTVNHWSELPKGKEALKFVNTLVKEGLFPEEAFTVKNYNDEIDKGSIFLLGNQNIFYTYSANKKLSATNPGKYYRFIEPIVKAGEKFEVQYNFRAFSWRGLTITKDSKHPDRAIKYIEYMISDEGQQLFLYGINGTHHTMKKTDKGWSYPEFNPDLSKLISSDFASLGSKYGVYAHLTHCWLIKEIYDYTFVYGLGFSPENKMKRDGELAYLKYRASNRITAIPNSIASPSSDELKPVPAKLKDFITQQFGKLLTAKTDEEFEKQYQALIDGYKTIGVDELKAYYVDASKKHFDTAQKSGFILN